MELEQKFYKDDNGRPIESNKIQSIGIIKYGSDGFYHWQCVDCNSVTSSRSCGWAIAGQVIQCDTCGVLCLLLRTDTDYITELCEQRYKSEERDKELERLKGIELINNNMIREISMKFHTSVTEALRKVADKEIYRDYKKS